MSDINSVCISGHIGKQPEMRYFESGKRVVNFSVAVNEWAGEEKGEVAHWFDCCAWDKRADFIGEYAKSGSLVLIGGRLAVDTYMAKSGTKWSRVYIKVDEIKIVGKTAQADNEQA